MLAFQGAKFLMSATTSGDPKTSGHPLTPYSPTSIARLSIVILAQSIVSNHGRYRERVDHSRATETERKRISSRFVVLHHSSPS
jgi:hypothetical protein